MHSNSSKPGGTFTVRVVHDGGSVHIEVEDNGGPWQQSPRRDDRPHGLDIIRDLASDHGIDGDAVTGRVPWARLDWPASAQPPAPEPDTDHRRRAAELRRQRPNWVVLWLPRTARYHAYPLLPSRTVRLTTEQPGQLAAQMDRAEQAARVRPGRPKGTTAT
jgi:hypothetical protein